MGLAVWLLCLTTSRNTKQSLYLCWKPPGGALVAAGSRNGKRPLRMRHEQIPNS